MANLAGFLGENPQAVFQSQLQDMFPQRRRFLGSKYSDIYGQYMSQQATQAEAGQMPTGDFLSFLKNYPWLQTYFSYSPQQRGFFPSRYAPPVRMLNY